jgi:hypothetical protein
MLGAETALGQHQFLLLSICWVFANSTFGIIHLLQLQPWAWML